MSLLDTCTRKVQEQRWSPRWLTWTKCALSCSDQIVCRNVTSWLHDTEENEMPSPNAILLTPVNGNNHPIIFEELDMFIALSSDTYRIRHHLGVEGWGGLKVYCNTVPCFSTCTSTYCRRSPSDCGGGECLRVGIGSSGEAREDRWFMACHVTALARPPGSLFHCSWHSD